MINKTIPTTQLESILSEASDRHGFETTFFQTDDDHIGNGKHNFVNIKGEVGIKNPEAKKLDTLSVGTNCLINCSGRKYATNPTVDFTLKRKIVPEITGVMNIRDPLEKACYISYDPSYKSQQDNVRVNGYWLFCDRYPGYKNKVMDFVENAVELAREQNPEKMLILTDPLAYVRQKIDESNQ